MTATASAPSAAADDGVPAAPCGNTNQMPDDAELQRAYARLDRNMMYFTWQNAWRQPTASAYVSRLLASDEANKDGKLEGALRGRLAAVTGVTVGGVGYVVAEELARLGMDVALLGRSSDKLKAAADAIAASGAKAKLHQVPFDLDDLNSAATAAAELKRIADEGYDGALHVLVNNAGANVPAREVTKQGIEVNTGRNFLAPHKLTSDAMPLLRRAAAGEGDFVPRVAFVASLGHVSGIDFDVERFRDVPDEGGCPPGHMADVKGGEEPASPLDKHYKEGDFMGGAKMYMYAKYAMIAATYAWAEREKEVAFYSLQPGSIASNFGGNAHWMLNLLYYKLFGLFQFTPEQGAVSTLRAVLDPTLVEAHRGGAYLHADGNPWMPRAPADPEVSVQELGEKIFDAAEEVIGKALG